MSSKTLTGILEWPDRTRGRVRQLTDAQMVQSANDDPYVPSSFAEKLPLRNGLEVVVEVVDRKPKRRSGRSQASRQARPTVENFISIEGLEPERYAGIRPFEDLTSIDPAPRLTLEFEGCAPSCRLVDLFCPIGRGQR